MVRRSTQVALSNPSASSDVGLRIRKARHERGMSLAQVGGQDLTRGFLSAVENGRSGISLQALSLVSDRLGLPLSYFLGEASGERYPAPELTLDQAEQALRTSKPGDALPLLAGMTEPGELTARKQWLQGWALVDSGRAREAISVLDSALRRAQEDGDVRQIVQVEYTLAMALFASGDYRESQAHLERAHEMVIAEVDDRALLGRITVALGHVQHMTGDTQGALERYARARQLFGAVNDLDNLAAVYSGLSRVHQQRGEVQRALRYSRLSLGILEARQNQRNAAHELNSIALRYRDLDDLPQALTVAQEAVSRAEECGAPDIEALAHTTLASVYIRLGDIDRARAEAEGALSGGIQDDDLSQVDALVVLADIAHRTHDAARTDELYDRALKVLEKSGSSTQYANVAVAYSDVLRSRGNIDGALHYALAAASALSVRRP